VPITVTSWIALTITGPLADLTVSPSSLLYGNIHYALISK